MSQTFYVLLALFGGLLYYLYLWGKKKHSYWAERGVKYVEPVPFFGQLLPVFLLKKGVGQVPLEIYRAYPNEKLVGYYNFTDPGVVVNDPELIEKITIKDFQHFVDRPHFGLDEESVSSKALFNLLGKEWRTARYKISPAFTTGKLKLTYQTMDRCSDVLIENIRKKTKNCEIKPLLVNYAIHTITTGVYGVEIKDEKTVKDFAEMADLLFFSGKLTIFRQSFLRFFPKTSRFLGLKFFNGDCEEYFKFMLESTFEQRKHSKLHNNDFVDFLLKLKNKIKLEAIEKDSEDSYLNLDESGEIDTIEFTDQFINGMAEQFILAGVLPLVQVALYSMFELALHPDCQEKARKEVREVKEKHGGYTYAALKEMTYLDCCLSEIMRMHSLVENLERICTKDYTTPDGLVIEKGTTVMIPIKEMIMDPKFFPNPDVFDPERFSQDSSIPSVFLPFGAGPRICIGMRYANLQVKSALAKIIGSFSFKPGKGVGTKLIFGTLSFVPILQNKIIIDFTPLE
ncbi:cytochrome P450 6k1-like [Cimex lectularius]|uniref:Cytochrome P450 n=1 Tax=Cimex lectularius TaxID=79782 RepID=A0A8I6TDP2_CIMLE|nr:cytochrome P450 6k1-like [Cimex lectularius]